MCLKTKSILALISMLLIATLNGCAKFATSDRKIAALESQVSIGMSENEFTESIPQATLLDEKDNKKFVTVHGIFLTTSFIT